MPRASECQWDSPKLHASSSKKVWTAPLRPFGKKYLSLETGHLVFGGRLLGSVGTDAGGPAAENCKSQYLLDVT